MVFLDPVDFRANDRECQPFWSFIFPPNAQPAAPARLSDRASVVKWDS
jgi:hypothetical protein